MACQFPRERCFGDAHGGRSEAGRSTPRTVETGGDQQLPENESKAATSTRGAGRRYHDGRLNARSTAQQRPYLPRRLVTRSHLMIH